MIVSSGNIISSKILRFEGEKKHKKGGLNCVSFFFISPTDVTVQKQITISF